MAKIPQWEKRIDEPHRVVWRNTYWMTTENKWATIEEVSISKSSIGKWTLLYFINDGSKSSFQENNYPTKESARKRAVEIMKNKIHR